MSMIKVSNLTFHYPNHSENVFEDVSFAIDTNWKLGFIGRNGKGKTTFLNLLLGKYEYSGSIKSDISFDYFPLEVANKKLNSYEIAETYNAGYEEWEFEREISLLDMNLDILNRPFETLSKGEQTKVLLAILFLKNNNFLLIDEPTNHLDVEARKAVSNYLNKKWGFILVSHDRMFLDNCVDHILAINRSDIRIEKGNFSTWYENKNRQDSFEISENEKAKREISKLEESARKTANWADKVERSKNNAPNDIFVDKGYIGHKSAKMMKRSISAQNRKEKVVEEKSKLLKNIEVVEDLKIKPLKNRNGHLIEAHNLEISYGNRVVVSDVSFYLNDGDRLQLKGKNGSGKSSIIKLILGDDINYRGDLYIQSGLKISYVSQDTSCLKGKISDFIFDNNLDELLFKSVLRRMDFQSEQFEKDICSYSEGQKKKLLLAKSICEQANIYIWDEPLNYIDIFSRIQIENLIKKYNLTMIFVEHDEAFSNEIATTKVELK